MLHFPLDPIVRELQPLVFVGDDLFAPTTRDDGPHDRSRDPPAASGCRGPVPGLGAANAAFNSEHSPASSARPKPSMNSPSTVWNDPDAYFGSMKYMIRPVMTTRTSPFFRCS